MSLEEDSSEILDPIVTTISFSSMKILIFNQSPNLLMRLQKISHVFISKKNIYLAHIQDTTYQDFANVVYTKNRTPYFSEKQLLKNISSKKDQKLDQM